MNHEINDDKYNIDLKQFIKYANHRENVPDNIFPVITEIVHYLTQLNDMKKNNSL